MTKRNSVAKDLRTPKYRMRVVVLKTKRPPKHKKKDLLQYGS